MNTTTQAEADATKQAQETRTAEAIKDVFKLGIFEPDELATDPRNVTPYTALKSIKFYSIFYFTDSDLYYLSEETEENLKETADQIHNTKKGRIYCYS